MSPELFAVLIVGGGLMLDCLLVMIGLLLNVTTSLHADIRDLRAAARADNASLRAEFAALRTET